jgi:hypothetical protein
MPPELQTSSLSKFEGNCSKTLNFLFFFSFLQQKFNFKIYLETPTTLEIPGTPTTHESRCCDYLFLTYEYHKSFRHSLRKKAKKRKMRLFVNVVKKNSKLVAISTNRIFLQLILLALQIFSNNIFFVL